MFKLERLLVLFTAMSFGVGLHLLYYRLDFIMESWARVILNVATILICAAVVWSIFVPTTKNLRIGSIYWLAQSFWITVGNINFSFLMGPSLFLSFRFSDYVTATINFLGLGMAYLFMKAAKLRKDYEDADAVSGNELQPIAKAPTE